MALSKLSWAMLKKVRCPWFVWLSIVILSVAIVSAIFGTWLAPHDATQNDLRNVLRPPAWSEGGSATNLLGTDHMGRDMFSRIIAGARISLIVALLVIGGAAFIGTLLGMVSAYFGGWVDMLMMRLADFQLSIPAILFALLLIVLLEPGLTSVIVVLVLTTWPTYARVVRSEVLSVKERDFVALAKVVGCSHARILTRYIFPNILHTFLVLCTLQVGVVIIFEASLSFLGLGTQPPQASWGSILADGRNYILSAWWIITFPGIALLLVVMASNLFGDWLRDRLDPTSMLRV